jgi:Flp pilus assembly protein TadD
MLGMHHARRGRWLSARDLLLQAHDLDPANPAICAAVAETYLQAPNALYPIAERWLHAAVDNAPADPRFHLLLARFYVEYGIDPGQRGLAAARVAADLSPSDAGAQETLGWAYHLSGQPARAIGPLDRARTLAPQEPRVSYRLGEVYRALGRADQARRFYQQAVDLDWHGPVGERARRAMRDLGGG